MRAARPLFDLSRCLLGAFICAGISVQSQREVLEVRLSDSHRWFELRKTISPTSSLHLRAAVAAAFNDPAAESMLSRVIRDAPRSAAADDAYALLARVYIRAGQYTRFANLYEEWRRSLPDSELLRSERENYDKFRQRPDQLNGSRSRSKMKRGVGGYLTLPIRIDGRAGEFIFDTGAWQSVVTERLAARLGLIMSDAGRVLTDVAGNRVRFKTALAKDVAIGDMRFQNVSFAVIAPQGPLAGVDFGIIGMPLILGIGSISWSNDGMVEFGDWPPARMPDEPNLAFDNRLVLQATIFDRLVQGSLDTGAKTTDLNANFAEMFPAAVKQGRQGSGAISGIGGTRTFESVELPELRILIGSRPVIARPAMVTLQRNATAGGTCCIGNFGHDLLTQGTGFTIDLRAMTLVLR